MARLWALFCFRFRTCDFTCFNTWYKRHKHRTGACLCYIPLPPPSVNYRPNRLYAVCGHMWLWSCSWKTLNYTPVLRNARRTRLSCNLEITLCKSYFRLAAIYNLQVLAVGSSETVASAQCYNIRPRRFSIKFAARPYLQLRKTRYIFNVCTLKLSLILSHHLVLGPGPGQRRPYSDALRAGGPGIEFRRA